MEAFHLVFFFFSFSKTEPKLSHFLLLLRSTSTLPSQLLFILVAYSFHHEVKCDRLGGFTTHEGGLVLKLSLLADFR